MNWFKCKQLAPAETWVRVKDFASGEVTRIPARELAPNMVEARVEGIEGTVWVDARQLQQGTLQQEPFSAELRDEIRVIQAAVEEFYPLSLDQWEDGFRRDHNPEKEIAIWLHIAQIYREFTRARDLTKEQRRDYFGITLACSNSPREHVLRIAPPQTISPDEAGAVIARFYGD